MPPKTPVFTVSKEVFSQRPDYVVGCVLLRNVDNTLKYPEISTLLKDAIVRARLTYESSDLKQIPELAAWRQAFSRQGWSASKYPSSAEAIIKRVSRNRDMPGINPVVDIANASVLFYAVPIGTHDVDTFNGRPLCVRPAEEGDSFLAMGNKEAESVAPGEIVYACGNSVRTRRWVWRQSQTALVQPETKNVFIPIDGFCNLTDAKVDAATTFVAETCQNVFGADVTIGMVTSENWEFWG